MIRKLPKERRGKKRGAISLPVKYSEPPEVDKEKKIQGEGTTSDFSSEGLGIFSDRELKPGTVLEIECEAIWEAPKQFTVQWCDRIEYNFYRLGLSVRK